MTGEGDMFIRDCLNSETQGSNIVGDNNNWSNVNTDAALLRALDEIGEQRKLTEAAQAQVARLIGVIESMTSKQ